MIPAWINRGSADKWEPGWMVDGSPSGAGEDYVLAAYDDKPAPGWNYPVGSLRLIRLRANSVRIRRTAIPLNDPVLYDGAEKNLPDAAKTRPGAPGKN